MKNIKNYQKNFVFLFLFFYFYIPIKKFKIIWKNNTLPLYYTIFYTYSHKLWECTSYHLKLYFFLHLLLKL